MNAFSWAILFPLFGIAFSVKCYPSLGISYMPCHLPPVGASNGSTGVNKPHSGQRNTILPCAIQQYKAGRPLKYTAENVPDEFELMLMDFNITANEKLLIKTFKCDFYGDEECGVAIIDDRATPPFFITMNKHNFALFSSSVSVTFRVDQDCSQACTTENTSSCTPDTGSCKSRGDSWQCECKPGYQHEEGNDKKCVDINECESYEEWFKCPSFAGSCTNLIGSSICDCYEAYQHPVDGNKQICESVFFFFDGPVNFNEAKTLCKNKGGHLATVMSQTESDSLLKEIHLNVGDYQEYERAPIIGLTQVSDTQYKWITGETIEVNLTTGGSGSTDDFVNFYPGWDGNHYDKWGRDEKDCIIAMNSLGMWIDYPCSEKRNYYICKIIHP